MQIHSESSRLIQELLEQPNYPCTAAVASLKRGECRTGNYGAIGTGASWRALRADLLSFLEELRRRPNSYLSYWAIFEDRPRMTEEEFESRLWFELSCLTSLQLKDTDWGPGAVTDPQDRRFCPSLAGETLFVVGLHPGSSRLSRQFKYPTLVFNAFSQFRALIEQGRYFPMVNANRERDLNFQGMPNPMVALHGETWESIQFSGRQNASDWKCPFRFLDEKEKP